MKTSPKQATSPFVVKTIKKKKKKERLLNFAHTQYILKPEISMYLLLFIYVIVIFFCFSFVTSKQYDMQHNGKRNTLTNKPQNPQPATTNIYKQLYKKKQAQSRL